MDATTLSLSLSLSFDTSDDNDIKLEGPDIHLFKVYEFNESELHFRFFIPLLDDDEFM